MPKTCKNTTTLPIIPTAKGRARTTAHLREKEFIVTKHANLRGI
jgi:hypothetical protein